MEDQPYTPPKAVLSDDNTEEHRQALDEFYLVSPFKFTLLYFSTLGIYSLY